MTENLVERLRAVRVGAGWGDPLCQEAADRIVVLEGLLDRSRLSLPECYLNLHAAINAALGSEPAGGTE